jgi:hypothetical protein
VKDDRTYNGDRGPDEGEEVHAGDRRVHVFPDPASVFPDDQTWLARVLHPLLTIELSAIESAWAGTAPILSPVEPLEGLLGDRTLSAHDAFAGSNWITFRRGEAGCWRFLGQRQYFEIEQPGAETNIELLKHYAAAEVQIAATRLRWERDGALTWGDHDDPTLVREGSRSDLALIDGLGGQATGGNWTSYGPPATLQLDETDDATPVLRLADGRPFTFIAWTPGYPWRKDGADAIMVFFEPETETLAVTFDWS